MNVHAWAEQRAKYSRAKHGRHERGASLFECALIAAVAQAKGLENARWATPARVATLGALARSEAPGAARSAA
ncbi:MAG: hypothetical protein M3O23_10215 [Actinomycetota bacterium]|nr:hypothetical protein [Actinomycetota bacterium]